MHLQSRLHTTELKKPQNQTDFDHRYKKFLKTILKEEVHWTGNLLVVNSGV